MLFKFPQTNERDELTDESTALIVKSLVQQAYRKYSGLEHAPGL
jgi:hypothetical protein